MSRYVDATFCPGYKPINRKKREKEREEDHDKAKEEYAVLSRGYDTTARLNLQYYLWEQQTRYQISPSIPLNKIDLKIADVGCGTGIWLVNLAKKVPASTTLHGFDIQSDGLPSPEWLSSNVSFHKLNILEPISEQFTEKYDVVHFRFLSLAVKNGNPSTLLSGAFQLLKPGGYLQWDERDITMRVDGPDVTQSMSNLVNEIRKFGDRTGRSFDWISSLGEAFKKSGFEIVDSKKHSVPKEMLGYHTDLILQTVNEGALGQDHVAGTATGDALRKKVNDAYDEYRIYGTAIQADLVLCVGRKPVGGLGKAPDIDEELAGLVADTHKLSFALS